MENGSNQIRKAAILSQGAPPIFLRENFKKYCWKWCVSLKKYEHYAMIWMLPWNPYVKSNPQCHGIKRWSFERWLAHEGRESSGMSLVPFKRGLKNIFCPFQHSKKISLSEPGSRLPLDTESAGNLILDYPSSRTMRNKCFL